MRIGISTRGLNQGSFAISTIIYNLTETIIKLAKPDHEIFLYFNDPECESLFDPQAYKRSFKLNNRLLWDHVWLPAAMQKDSLDIALFMKGTIPVFLPCSSGVIFHDLGYFDDSLRPYKLLETIYMRRMIADAGKRAAVVFADTAYTKEEAVRLLGLDPSKVIVCYQNASSLFRPVIEPEKLDAVRQMYALPDQFIFSPQSVSPRKNIDRILDAFDKVRGQVPHDLVLTGGQSWRAGEAMRRITSDPDGRVRILGDVAVEDMPALYSLASFTLYPSLLEGFGLPILEAFRCGCPVLTSNITSMPEVAGGAAYLVDPYDAGQIAEGIYALATDESLRNDLIEKGVKRAEFFSWEKTARIILDGFEGVA